MSTFLFLLFFRFFLINFNYLFHFFMSAANFSTLNADFLSKQKIKGKENKKNLIKI